MVRISLIASLLVIGATSGQVNAQCQGGGGGSTASSTTSTTSGTSTGGTSASAARLLTGPGSFAYDVMVAQAIQRQIAQRQYVAAVQKQAKRQADLEKRRYAVAIAKVKLQDQRQRMHAFLAEKYGTGKTSAKPATAATYQTAYCLPAH